MKTQLHLTLLLSSALVAPAALAQSAPPSAPSGVGNAPTDEDTGESPAEAEAEGDQVEISTPGADPGEAPTEEEVVVTGRFIPNPVRRSPEVSSVLSSADIARTGDGDVAGALERVTGLSVVGSRFVYVRGLGERYSLALLNGSPLPSPEPLRRVIPLDLFPTSIVASTLVQKSYSVNYPGEFGGGVINITTRTAPDEPFIAVGASVGVDTVTTARLGYTYDGSDSDFTGFDDGTRDVPRGLRNAFGSGNLIVEGASFSRAQIREFTASLVNAPTTLIQRNGDIPANGSFEVSGGTTVPIGGAELGVLASAAYSNSWQTRGGLQQRAFGTGLNAEGGTILNADQDFRFLRTDNRIIVNGLLGLNLDLGDHEVRFTNLFIRDTVKQARIQQGTDAINVGTDLLNTQFTGWFERQLIDTQLAAEFEFGKLGVDIRGTYANSQRESPYERNSSYRFDPSVGDFVNDLRTNGQFSRIAFSDLTDDVYGGGIDLSYDVGTDNDLVLSTGYAYFQNDRASVRRDFRFQPAEGLPLEIAQERIDFLLSDFNIANSNILLTDISGSAGAAAFDAKLRVHGGYVQAQGDIVPERVSVQLGVRYEDGEQTVTPRDLFGTGVDLFTTRIANDYFLPAVTVTINPVKDVQLRLHASKTIARPQFRELAPQQYQDIESDRTFFGNQFLQDTTLKNYEARAEYYLGRDQRITAAGFYKELNRPIEAIAFEQGGSLLTTFANAPAANLYGGEIEAVKYVALENLLGGPVFTPRRLFLSANYTFTESKIEVGANDITFPVQGNGTASPANIIFQDGERLTGQSRHIANLQVGLENTERLSQQTVLLAFASRRISNRGPASQPDFIEEPGLRLDFVAREGFAFLGGDFELKFEARNLLGENAEEYQTLNGSRIDINTFDLGRTYSLGLSARF